MSYGNGRSFGGGQAREQRFERPRHAESSPYVHPSRQQTVPANVDLTAPVIHFGTSREVAPRQSMKDQHFARAQDEKNQVFLTPATKEQKLLTLFVGGIGAETDDYWMDRILKSAAKLKVWKRATDGTGEPCPFGFAEYEDPENLSRAYQLLQSFRLPDPKSGSARQFIISQDETSKLYVEDFLAAKDSQVNETKERNILSSASGQLERVVKDFTNADFKRHDEQEDKLTKTAKKVGTTAASDAEAVTIMLSIEDELGDIPEEQRESIAKEITSFRERSAKRDQERARQIADAESRRLEFERASRQAPRSNGTEKDGTTEIAMIRRTKKERGPFEEENMSEEEIAHRREEQRVRDAQIRYLDEERRWHSREASRIAAYERENVRREEESSRRLAEKEHIAQKLSTFDDDKEAARGVEDFYRDRSAWARSRGTVKIREAELDKQDRIDEERETELEASKARTSAVKASSPARGSMTGDRAVDADVVVGPVRLSLARKAEEIRKPMVNAEAILQDEEDGTAKKRVLVPLEYEDEETRRVVDHEAEQARLRSILENIPTSREDLWKYTVSWDKLNEVIVNKVQEFVGKKIVEAIGMEEEDLIAFVMNKIRSRGHPQEIVQELGSAIGDMEESELLTVKIWRYLLMVTETA